MIDLEDAWNKWVRPLVPGNLPDLALVVSDLKKWTNLKKENP